MSFDRDPSYQEHAAALSSLIDGELARDELLPLLDQLVRSPELRSFYKRARALDGMAQAAEVPAADDEPPEEVWTRIEESTSSFLRGNSGDRWLRWAPRLAAALLLSFGIWAVVQHPLPTGGLGEEAGALGEVAMAQRSESGDAEREAAVELPVSDALDMTDERFIELATELLRAPSRYHQEMFRVMAQVTEESIGEALSREDAPRSEGRRVSLGDEEPGFNAESFSVGGIGF